MGLYTKNYALNLGAGQTGLTLEAQFVNSSGVNVGAAVTTGFTEIGGGFYLWTYASFDDTFRGGIKFQVAGGGALKTFVALNPPVSDTRWAPYGNLVTLATTLLNFDTFVSGAKILSDAVDNTTDLHLREDLELTVTLADTPLEGGVVEVYQIVSLDGTNFADGSEDIDPSPAALVGAFRVRESSQEQRISLRSVRVPPGIYKYLLWNKTGSDTLGTNNQLKKRGYHQQTVGPFE